MPDPDPCPADIEIAAESYLLGDGACGGTTGASSGGGSEPDNRANRRRKRETEPPMKGYPFRPKAVIVLEVPDTYCPNSELKSQLGLPRFAGAISIDHGLRDVRFVAQRRTTARPAICASLSAASASAICVVRARAISWVAGNRFANQDSPDFFVRLHWCRTPNHRESEQEKR